MKKNYFTFGTEEITIYCGENSRSNCVESLKQAAAIAGKMKDGKVLYLNTFLTPRKIMAARREHIGEKVENLLILNSEIGRLTSTISYLEDMIEKEKIKYIMINSWEFAHRNYQLKEAAIFDLMRLMNSFGVTVIVYSQAKPAMAGKIQRGGLGKLAALAWNIITIEADDIQEFDLPDLKNGKLIPIEINELVYAQHGSGISVGGKLILPEAKAENAAILEEAIL